MRKVSDILGKTLICLCEGTNEGVIKNITFDKKLCKPKWLILSDACDEADFAVAFTDVFRLGNDAAVIKSRNVLLPAAEVEIEQNNPINCDVYTTFGKRLGAVKDVYLHDTKSETVSLLLEDCELPAARVFAAGGNAVIVLDEEASLRVTAPKQKTVRKKKQQPATIPASARAGETRATIPVPSQSENGSAWAPPSESAETAAAADTAETEWQPPKPEGQKKLIGDYNFLLGRKTNDDIYNKQNEKIIKKNTIITRETVEKARAAGKLIDLTVRSLPEHYIY